MRGGEYSPDQNNGDYIEQEGSPSQNTATEKLVASRQNRKKAEEDVKLLANRIALLKKEEQKVISLNPSY